MAYVHAVIPVTVPLNTDPVSEGAEKIRQLAASIKERLESCFVDVDDEPMIYNAGLIQGNTVVNGTLIVVGTVTATGFVGPFNSDIDADQVTAGTFKTGGYTFPGSVTGGRFTAGRTVSAVATGAVAAAFTGVNHLRYQLTGNATITLGGGVVGTVYTVELFQDGTGGRTVTWANVDWGSLDVPTQTVTPGRKDIYAFMYDGGVYCCMGYNQNFSSTN